MNELSFNRFKIGQDYAVYGEINFMQFLRITMHNKELHGIPGLIQFIKDFLKQIVQYAKYRNISHFKGLFAKKDADTVPFDYYDFLKTDEGKNWKKELFEKYLAMNPDIYADKENYKLFLAVCSALEKQGYNRKDLECMTFDPFDRTFRMPDGTGFMVLPKEMDTPAIAEIDAGKIVRETDELVQKVLREQIKVQETEVKEIIDEKKPEKEPEKEEQKEQKSPEEKKYAVANDQWTKVSAYQGSQQKAKKELRGLLDEEKKRAKVSFVYRPEHFTVEGDRVILNLGNLKMNKQHILLSFPKEAVKDIDAKKVCKRWDGMNKIITTGLLDDVVILDDKKNPIKTVKTEELLDSLMLHQVKIQRDPNREDIDTFLNRIVQEKEALELRGYPETAERVDEILKECGFYLDQDGVWHGKPYDETVETELRERIVGAISAEVTKEEAKREAGKATEKRLSAEVKTPEDLKQAIECIDFYKVSFDISGSHYDLIRTNSKEFVYSFAVTDVNGNTTVHDVRSVEEVTELLPAFDSPVTLFAAEPTLPDYYAMKAELLKDRETASLEEKIEIDKKLQDINDALQKAYEKVAKGYNANLDAYVSGDLPDEMKEQLSDKIQQQREAMQEMRRKGMDR